MAESKLAARFRAESNISILKSGPCFQSALPSKLKHLFSRWLQVAEHMTDETQAEKLRRETRASATSCCVYHEPACWERCRPSVRLSAAGGTNSHRKHTGPRNPFRTSQLSRKASSNEQPQYSVSSFKASSPIKVGGYHGASQLVNRGSGDNSYLNGRSRGATGVAFSGSQTLSLTVLVFDKEITAEEVRRSTRGKVGSPRTGFAPLDQGRRSQAWYQLFDHPSERARQRPDYYGEAISMRS